MRNEDQHSQDLIGSDLVREDSSFAGIVVQFVEGLNHRVTTLEEAVNAGDFQALGIAAHQLKGSGGGYGYPMLSDQAAKLEREAKKRAREDCVKSFNQLKKLCERVVVSAD